MKFHSSTVPIFPLNTSTSLFSHQMLTESTSSKYPTFLSNSLAVTKAKPQEIERNRLQHYSITQTPPIPTRKKNNQNLYLAFVENTNFTQERAPGFYNVDNHISSARQLRWARIKRDLDRIKNLKRL